MGGSAQGQQYYSGPSGNMGNFAFGQNPIFDLGVMPQNGGGGLPGLNPTGQPTGQPYGLPPSPNSNPIERTTPLSQPLQVQGGQGPIAPGVLPGQTTGNPSGTPSGPGGPIAPGVPQGQTTDGFNPGGGFQGARGGGGGQGGGQGKGSGMGSGGSGQGTGQPLSPSLISGGLQTPYWQQQYQQNPTNTQGYYSPPALSQLGQFFPGLNMFPGGGMGGGGGGGKGGGGGGTQITGPVNPIVGQQPGGFNA